MSIVRSVAALSLAAVVAMTASATDYTITATALGTSSDGTCNLRDAIEAARSDSAVDACPAGGAVDVIELATTGTYTFSGGQADFNSGALTIRGADPANAGSYVIDLGLSNRFLDVWGGAEVVLADLSIILGSSGGENGGTVRSSGSDLTLHNVVILWSESDGKGGAISFDTPAVGGGDLLVEDSHFGGCNGHWGGGLFARLDGAGTMILRDVTFDGVDAGTAGPEARGGSVYIDADYTASMRIERVHIEDGELTTPGSSARGGGLGIVLDGAATATITDLTVERVTATSADGVASNGAGVFLEAWDDSELVLDRCRIAASAAGHAGSSQLSAAAYELARVRLSNLVLVDSPMRGAEIYSSSSGDLLLDHITVSGNDGWQGLAVGRDGSGGVTIANSIVWGNPGGALATWGSPTLTDVLTNADPLFVDAPAGDYRLGPGSPAANAGAPVAPGLPPLDVDLLPRVWDGQTDLGAHERVPLLIFADGVERNDLGAWSATVQ